MCSALFAAYAVLMRATAGGPSGVALFNTNAAANGAYGAADPVPRNPTTGIPGCCARPATGHAAAPPRSEMNSRRAFATMTQLLRVGALAIGGDQLFMASFEKLAELDALPTISVFREFTASGGLMSYGASSEGLHRLAVGLRKPEHEAAYPTRTTRS